MEIVQRMINVNEYVKSDLYRYTGKTTYIECVKLYIKNPAFRVLVGVRLSQSKGLTKIVGKVLYRLSPKQKIQISNNTKIGYGLFLSHGGPVVISPSAVIGNNCNIGQFTTIGANEGKAAEIGDNCYIGPGCCIVENVKLGKSVTIGAGSVVVKDIPENATAAGNYAKVLNYNNPGRYIHNKWENTKK